MGFRATPFTELVYERWTKEGRGTGEGAAYKPWLQPGDVPTNVGNMVRFVCAKSGRSGVSFSMGEDDARLYYETKAVVKAIYEQFPLDRERTRRIARQMGVAHPADPHTKVDTVMTTDLVIHGVSADGARLVLPRSFKPESRLHVYNNAEHAEIERRYWAEEGEVWKFLTDSQACTPAVLRENLYLLKPFRFELEDQPWEGYWPWLLENVATQTRKHGGSASFDAWCGELDHKLGIREQHSRYALCYLVHRQQIRFDLASAPLQQFPVELLEIDLGAIRTTA